MPSTFCLCSSILLFFCQLLSSGGCLGLSESLRIKGCKSTAGYSCGQQKGTGPSFRPQSARGGRGHGGGAGWGLPGSCGHRRPSDGKENTSGSSEALSSPQEGRLLLSVQPWHRAGTEASWGQDPLKGLCQTPWGLTDPRVLIRCPSCNLFFGPVHPMVYKAG